jgi:RNA polymerase-interacting CarD/CdnL/TRCF family regulator
MTRYIVKLTEQEELTLRQLAIQPGFEVIFKLLQGESLDAQTAAMECTDPDNKKRLLLLTDAQATAKIVSNLTRKLAAYREVIQEVTKEQDLADQLIGDAWTRERTN